jgi:hypothetical protein
MQGLNPPDKRWLDRLPLLDGGTPRTKDPETASVPQYLGSETHSGLPDCRTAGLPDCRTAGLPDCRKLRLRIETIFFVLQERK